MTQKEFDNQTWDSITRVLYNGKKRRIGHVNFKTRFISLRGTETIYIRYNDIIIIS